MEIAFAFLSIAGIVFGLPAIALIVAAKASRRAGELSAELDRLRSRLQYTEHHVAELTRRVAAPPREQPFAAAVPPGEPRPVAPAEAVEPARPEPARVVRAQAAPEPARADAALPEPAQPDAAAAEPARPEAAATGAPAGEPAPPRVESETASPHLPVPPAPEAPPAPPAPAGLDWEGLIGVRLFAWIGGGALFLGAALFLHYSIQQNLISPPLRVAIGLAFGAACLFGGDRLRERTDMAGQALTGAGVAILYAALFAARTLYQLIDSWLAFAGMALVTLTAGVIAVRRNTLLVALLGVLGGMATPYLLSSGEDRPLALLGYVTLLDAGVLFVAGKRRWPVLALVALACSLVLYIGWADRYLDGPRVVWALVALAAVCGLFSLFGVRAAAAAGRSRSVARIVVLLGALAPLAGALVMAPMDGLEIEPWALGLQLVLVLGIAWAASHGAELPGFMGAAALLAVITLLLRQDRELFVDGGATTLAAFALPVAAVFGAWLVRRKRADAPVLRLALAVLACGAGLVVARAAVLLPSREWVGPALAYAAVNVLLLVVVGAVERAGRFLAAAHATSVVALFVCCSMTGPFERLVLPIAISGLSFWALPFMAAGLRSDRSAWVSSALALPAHFLLLYGLVRSHWPAEYLGSIAVGCAGLSLVSLTWARRLCDDQTERLLYSALFAAETLAFVTAAVPIVLEKEWITVAWALELAGLSWLLGRIPHRLLHYAVALLAVAVGMRLLTNPALWHYHPRSDTPLLNFYLYTFGVPALAFFAGARWLERVDERPLRQLPALLRLFATVFVFVLLNVEVADYYSTGSTLAFNFSGGGLAQDMTYSLVWGAFALGLLVFGIARRSRPPRIGALVVLTLTIAKVFLHDLWELGSLYRVGSILGLALALLGVSFLIQRFILRKEPA